MSGFKINRNILLIGVVLIIIIGGGIYWDMTKPQPKQHLIVSTTTSLYETGVLDAIKPMFEAEHPAYNVSFISQGTGLAIETAKNGDADMILVHSPGQELGFLESGYGVNRKLFAYNFFIIVGPASDPAGILNMLPGTALTKLTFEGPTGNALWVSRGDNSGTHSKEKSLWAVSGFDLEVLKSETVEGTSEPWYIEAGAGMTATLQLANEKEAYTLTDMATYLKNYKNGNIESITIVGQGKETLNVYAAILCNPEENPRGMYDGALLFMEYILSKDVQDMLVEYGFEEFGSTLFKPWIPELDTPDSEIVQWVKEYAYIDGSECPEEYRHLPGNLYD
jgi:tungstate transport system substrate-binding protein